MIRAMIVVFVLLVSFGATFPGNATSVTRPYDQGTTNRVSNGSCVCKRHCNEFAAHGQLTGETLKQCKSDCEQTYSGCTKGTMRR